MSKDHNYALTTKWTGNTGAGTLNYTAFERSYTISAVDKADIAGSSDPAFRGDPTKHNPEELLLASLSSCHMLWYLHLCAQAEIVVIDYVDHATGVMEETAEGGGKFKLVTLNPVVTITDINQTDKAISLHQKANELCFIANSVNFPVNHRPNCKISFYGNKP